MSGFLLDTGVFWPWFNEDHSNHPSVMANRNAVPDTQPILMSVVSLGEIIFGHGLFPVKGSAEFRKWIDDQFPKRQCVSDFTCRIYGKIRAELSREFAPPGGWTRKKRTEQLTDPATGFELGIDENDLWLAAQAVERNLVLVTTDKMDRIRKAIARLPDDEYGNYSGFQTANWLIETVPG